MHDDASTILLVEDDDATRTFLADNLTADGYDLVVAETVRDGARLIETKYPDLVVVDVGLPDGSGLDLLARVREADGLASRVDPFTPVIVLSGRAAEVDRVRGFERGADDYVAKPFAYNELRHRVAALLRRAQARGGRSRMRVGPLEIVPDAREVRVHGERVELSQKEYALLRALADDPLRVCTKDELLKSIWGFQSRGRTRTLDSHACRLRAKLGEHGGRWVVNVWGVGYKLLEGAVA
jgi:DNA-binding response OmpR family regulator